MIADGTAPALKLRPPFRCILMTVCAGSMMSTMTGAAEPIGVRASNYSQDPAILDHGKVLFTSHCTSCHTLTKEGIGPPLGGITTLLPASQLEDWIREPAKVIASGDVRANALLYRYKTPMPSFAQLRREEVAAILAYIDHESAIQQLPPLLIDAGSTSTPSPRWSDPIRSTNLVIELEDVVQLPRLPGRTPYKGITLLRADPRESGALFIDELMGVLYRVKDREVGVFLDVRTFFAGFICDPGVASGLGSFALHPEFVRNGIFYTLHSETFRGSPAVNASDIPADVPEWETPPLEWVLTEWRLTDPTATTFAGMHREVMRFVTPTTGHAGQEIAFAPVSDANDPDYAKLYIAIGDGGSGNLGRPDMAGHPRTFLGAILRIDPAGRDSVNGQYGIPPDNPFAQYEDATVRKEIWAYGFRNPHRLSWDLTHGKRMISVDIGEANVEEVNLIRKGGAYGWGVAGIEGRTRIDVKKDLKVVHAATAAELAGVELPLADYDHIDGAAITGGYVYRGPLAPLRGKYIFGDIVNGRLFYMNVDAELTDRAIYEINLVRDGVPTNIKTLAQATRAHLRFGYDDRTGDMYILTKDDGTVRKIAAAYVR